MPNGIRAAVTDRLIIAVVSFALNCRQQQSERLEMDQRKRLELDQRSASLSLNHCGAVRIDPAH